MNDAISFEIHGLKELERELLRLPDKIARRSLARAANEGARFIRDKARENVTASGLVDTGTMRKSIRTIKKRHAHWRTTQIYGVRYSSAPYKRKLGHRWSMPYGLVYEYGSDKRGIRKWGFIRRALDGHMREAAKKVKDRLWNEIATLQLSGYAKPKRR